MPRKTGKGFSFKPFSRKQRQLMYWWEDGSPYQDLDMVIADGAIRSGKTVAMICGFFLWSMSTFEGETFILAGKTIGALKKNVIGPALQILRGWGKPYTYVSSGDEARLEVGANTYYLYDAHNERSQDRLQGLTAAGALADEVALFPRNFVEQMIGRCSVDGARLWLNCNPENPAHYVKAELIDKEDEKKIYHLHFLMEDNLSLSPKIRDRYQRMFSGVFYDRYVRGLWVPAEGMVYDMFDKSRHVLAEDPGTEGDHYVSSDFGIQNATVFLLWRKESGSNRWICLREYYYSGRSERRQKTVSELVDGLSGMLGEIKPKRVIVDPSASALKVELRKRGYYTQDANNDVLDGISDVSSMLQDGNLAFMPCCENTIQEFSQYMWDKKAADHGVDAPVKENDHAMDAVRYFVKTKRLVKKTGA